MVVEGETLYGDYLVPPGLAAVIDWSFPSRSVEAITGSMMGPTATGRTHELVITAVALLGVDLPGVSTLPDLMDVLATFSGEQPEQAWSWRPSSDPSERVEPVDTSRAIRAGLDQELVRRRFFDLADSGTRRSTCPRASAAGTCGSGRCASMTTAHRSSSWRRGSRAGCTGTASRWRATTWPSRSGRGR
jgi:hypothetical protein